MVPIVFPVDLSGKNSSSNSWRKSLAYFWHGVSIYGGPEGQNTMLSFDLCGHSKYAIFTFFSRNSAIMMTPQPGHPLPTSTHRATQGGPGPDHRISWLRCLLSSSHFSKL